jgi:hypothetical protein
MKMYEELAGWWPLLSTPDDDVEEAAFFREAFVRSGAPSSGTMLELGSGGGNIASHLKMHHRITLVDVSRNMLDVSRGLNPECEHVEGDMRQVRLALEFDAVFVHDAIDYMLTDADLSAAMRTAFAHCRPGGVAMFVPDHVRETFAERTSTGGHDGEGRSLRYIQWEFDPDPADTTTIADFALLLRDPRGDTRIVHDRHVHGLFARDLWLKLLHESGFAASVVRDDWGRDVFVARRLG